MQTASEIKYPKFTLKYIKCLKNVQKNLKIEGLMEIIGFIS